MALKGSIEDFPLEDVLSLVASTEKTGVLRVTPYSAPAGEDSDAGATSTLWLSNGLLVGHAVEGAQDARDALFRCLRTQSGTFSFETGTPLSFQTGPPPADTYRGTEVGPLLEEWRSIAALVAPSIESVKFAPDLSVKSVEFSAEEWKLIASVAGLPPLGESDGSADIVERLVHGTGLTTAEVVTGLAALVARGLLIVYPPLEAQPAPLVSSLATAPVPEASTPVLPAPVPEASTPVLPAPVPEASTPVLPAPVPEASTPVLPAPVPEASTQVARVEAVAEAGFLLPGPQSDPAAGVGAPRPDPVVARMPSLPMEGLRPSPAPRPGIYRDQGDIPVPPSPHLTLVPDVPDLALEAVMAESGDDQPSEVVAGIPSEEELAEWLGAGTVRQATPVAPAPQALEPSTEPSVPEFHDSRQVALVQPEPTPVALVQPEPTPVALVHQEPEPAGHLAAQLSGGPILGPPPPPGPPMPPEPGPPPVEATPGDVGDPVGEEPPIGVPAGPKVIEPDEPDLLKWFISSVHQ